MNAEIYTGKLILEYTKKFNRDIFTYNDLRRFYYSKLWKEKRLYEWHTIERVIRKFSERKIIIRLNKKSGRRGIYKVIREKLLDFLINLIIGEYFTIYTLSDGRKLVKDVFGRMVIINKDEDLKKLALSYL